MSEQVPAEDDAAGDSKPEKTAYEKLSPRNRRFVDLIVQGAFGAAAARELGIGGDRRPQEWASRVRARPDVKAAIAEREAMAAAEAGITQTRIYRELGHVAFFDHRKLYDENGKALPIHMLPPEVASGLAATEIDELFEGVGREREQIGIIRKYKSWPKVDALKLLAQLMKMLTEKVELAGPNGQPLATAGPVLHLTLNGDVEQSAEPDSATEAESGIPIKRN